MNTTHHSRIGRALALLALLIAGSGLLSGQAAARSAGSTQAAHHSAARLDPVPQPPSLTLTAGTSKVKIAWGVLNGNGAAVDGIIIYRSTTLNSQGSLAAIVPGTAANSWVDNGANGPLAAPINGTAYYYSAQTYKSSGSPSAVSAQSTTTPAVPSIATSVLLNVDSGTAISGYSPFVNGQTFDFGVLGTPNLSVWAVQNSTTTKVTFTVDSASSYEYKDSAYPFTIAGETTVNSTTTINKWTPSLGHHTLTIVPEDFSGATGTTATIGFDASVSDLGNTPFASNSPWKKPLSATGLTPVTGPDARSTDVQALGGYINADNGYGHPVYFASSSDPLITVTVPTYGDITLNLPAGASGAAGTDGDIAIIDPTRTYGQEFWKLTPPVSPSTKWTAGNYAKPYITPDSTHTAQGVGWGIRASSFSVLGGLLRVADVQRGVVDHALAMTLPNGVMLSGPKSPATTEDNYFSCKGMTMVAACYIPGSDPLTVDPAKRVQMYGRYTTYGASYANYPPEGTVTGHVRIGQKFVLDPGVTIASLGLSTSFGTAIATAVRDYGVYVGDTEPPKQNSGGNAVISAEPGVQKALGNNQFSTAAPHISSNLIHDWRLVVQHLVPVG